MSDVVCSGVRGLETRREFAKSTSESGKGSKNTSQPPPDRGFDRAENTPQKTSRYDLGKVGVALTTTAWQ